MTGVTQILASIERGDPHAAEQLLPLVYDELRKLAAARIAQEAPGQTLQATALVHEAYLRLVGSLENGQSWDSRGHFFTAAAESMRRILIDRARAKSRQKRGEGLRRLDLDMLQVADKASGEQLLALADALEQLAQKHPLCAQLVNLRFFAGLSGEQASSAMGISPRTADRHWAFARAWLYRQMRERED
jgi:RNA polymerase sigma factor (TIGR02999 family)